MTPSHSMTSKPSWASKTPVAAYTVLIERAARRALKGLHPQDRQRIVMAVELLATEPRPSAATQLRGRDAWRVRVGDFRVIYEIHDDQLVVYVVTLGHRREVYR